MKQVYTAEKIECEDTVEINGAKNGMTFNMVREKLGKSQIVKSKNGYELNYLRGDIKIKYLSNNQDGSDGKFILYRYSLNPQYSSDVRSAVIPIIKSNAGQKLKNGDKLTVEIRRGSYTGVTNAVIEQLDENFNKIKGLDVDITNKLQLNFDGFDASGGHSSQLPSQAFEYKISKLNPYTKYFRVAVKYNSFGTDREESVYSDLITVKNIN